MITGTHTQLGTLQVKEMLPEEAGEDFISVGDDGLWDSMEAHNMTHESLGYGSYCVRVIERYEVCRFGESIDHNQDDCMPF